MHVCIDEDTTDLNPLTQEKIGVPLQKTYRRKVFVQSIRSDRKTPRRPRFPFFSSSHCQRPDPSKPKGPRRRWKPKLPKLKRTENRLRFPGSNPALSKIFTPKQWERKAHRRSAFGLYNEERFLRQDPSFNFQTKSPEAENPGEPKNLSSPRI